MADLYRQIALYLFLQIHLKPDCQGVKIDGTTMKKLTYTERMTPQHIDENIRPAFRPYFPAFNYNQGHYDPKHERYGRVNAEELTFYCPKADNPELEKEQYWTLKIRDDLHSSELQTILRVYLFEVSQGYRLPLIQTNFWLGSSEIGRASAKRLEEAENSLPSLVKPSTEHNLGDNE